MKPLAVLAALAASIASATPGVPLAQWRTYVHLDTPTDIVGPTSDGSLIVATAGGLTRVAPSGKAERFASAYKSSGGEPYIALAPAGCFGAGTVYALKPTAPQGVLDISPHKHPRLLAMLRAPGLANGIAFDTTGDFGGRLLVSVNDGPNKTTVYAIGCGGRVQTITRTAPTLEGGLVIAPRSFGRFGGDLIAPDELSGRILAISPTGRARLVARSGLPAGQDIGVESLGFVAPGDTPYEVFQADRFTPGSLHPGDDVVLSLESAALRREGVRGGDLLASTEGGALVDAVVCDRRGCNVREVARGPAIAHGEGHLAVLIR